MMHQRRFRKEFEVEAVRQVQTAGEASVRSSHIGGQTRFLGSIEGTVPSSRPGSSDDRSGGPGQRLPKANRPGR
jgi:hypothetical protein